MISPAPPRPSRRLFLLSGGLAAASAALAYVMGTDLWKAYSARRHARPRLLELLGGADCTDGVGQAYVRAHAQEANVGVLRDLILPGVDVEHAPLADLGAAFRQRVQTDLDADELVEVDGWLFARTEARLFAMDAVWKAEQTS